MWKWMGVFLRKNHVWRCWGCLSVLNRIGALRVSLSLKLPRRKLEPWLALWSLFLLRLLCTSVSIIRPCMGCYLKLLDKLQKWICRTAAPSPASFLEPVAHHQNLASLSHFYSYYFGHCSSEQAQMVPLSYSRGRSARYSDRLHEFSDFYATKVSMSTFSFLAQVNSVIFCL